MAYKKISGELTPEILEDIEKNGIILACQDVGYEIEGIYDGFVEIPGFEGKGKQKRHTVILEGGELLMFRGFGLVDYILEKVETGSQTKITYDGKVDKYHKCTVAVDDGEVAPIGEITKATQVADANAKKAMVEKHFGDQDIPSADELAAMDFFEFMLAARDILEKSTGSKDFYNEELKSKFQISFLSQVKGDSDTQAEIRGHFEGFVAEAMGAK